MITLTYFGTGLILTVKSFSEQALSVYFIKHFFAVNLFTLLEARLFQGTDGRISNIKMV
jgi:hypothetical protein